LLTLLPSRISLRMRVMLCCAALGGVIGVCLAIASEQIAVHFEHVLINEEMNAELDMQIAQQDGNVARRLPHSPWKSVYIDRPGQPPTSPPALRSLPPGIHELEEPEDRDQFAAIRIAPIGRVTLVAGLPSSPARERRFAAELLAMILLGIALGAWLGRMLAGSMLAPVLALAHDVDSPEPGAVWQTIAADHRADEVGALANALIRYRTRMRAAIEREVLFSADASHELRTPLTVLQGTLDLLRETAGAGGGRGRIDRMQRSSDEMATLLDALLLIARPAETIDTKASVELGPALASVVAEFRQQLDAAQIALGLRCADGASMHAPPELLRVSLRLLFRSIASGAYGNALRLDADARGIVLAAADGNAGAAAVHTGGERRSDETGGVGMLRRLCRRYGWALELADDPAQSTLLTLRFWAPETSAEFTAVGTRG
jgi:signal transduction histidine kinase